MHFITVALICTANLSPKKFLKDLERKKKKKNNEMKYADDVGILTEKITVLQDMIN